MTSLMLRFVQIRISPPLAIPHAHSAAVANVSATGKGNAIHGDDLCAVLTCNLRRPVGGAVVGHDDLRWLDQMSRGNTYRLNRRLEDGLLVPSQNDERDEVRMWHGVLRDKKQGHPPEIIGVRSRIGCAACSTHPPRDIRA